MKFYLDIPFASKYKEKTTHLPICLGFVVSWTDYDFKYQGNDDTQFPKGDKKGKHKLSIKIGVCYWWITLTLYKPIQ